MKTLYKAYAIAQAIAGPIQSTNSNSTVSFAAREELPKPNNAAIVTLPPSVPVTDEATLLIPATMTGTPSIAFKPKLSFKNETPRMTSNTTDPPMITGID